MAVRWEATDQFGNLYVGNSDAYDIDALRADLESMVAAVAERRSTGVAFSIDLEYSEISAPEAGQVSHVMNAPWLGDRVSNGESENEVLEEVQSLLQELIAANSSIEATVQGPWQI